MGRIRHRLSYSDTRAELVEHKDARRGASEDEFWDEDEVVDYRPSRKEKTKKKKKGCPENDGKAHVYIWVDWPDEDYEYPWFIKNREAVYEIKVCCGCEHRAPGKSFRRKNSHATRAV